MWTDNMVAFVPGDQIDAVEVEHLPWDGLGKVEMVGVPSVAGDAGFGLQFGGAKDPTDAQSNRRGIFISGVVSGTPAASLTSKLVGKQVVAVAGKDMVNGTLVDLIRALQEVYDRTEGDPSQLQLQVTNAAGPTPAWATGTVTRTGNRGLIPLTSILPIAQATVVVHCGVTTVTATVPVFVRAGQIERQSVTLERGNAGESFGFGLGFAEGHHVVSSVAPGGIAANALMVSDMVLSVNEASLEGMDHDAAVELIGNATTVSLDIERRMDTRSMVYSN
jgi:C-terminal processing protease CtpA/Prc